MLFVSKLALVDYVMLGVLLLAFFTGWNRGLVRVLAGVVTFFLTTFLAGRYSDDLIRGLNSAWGLQDRIVAFLTQRLNLPVEAYKTLPGPIPGATAANWTHGLPVPEAYQTTLADQLVAWSSSAGHQTPAAYIVQQLAAGVMQALVFSGLTMLLGWAIFRLVGLASEQLSRIPLVGTANRLVGGLILTSEAAVMLALIVGLVVPFLSVTGAPALSGYLDHSYLAPYFLKGYGMLRGFLFGLGQEPFFTT